MTVSSEVLANLRRVARDHADPMVPVTERNPATLEGCEALGASVVSLFADFMRDASPKTPEGDVEPGLAEMIINLGPVGVGGLAGRAALTAYKGAYSSEPSVADRTALNRADSFRVDFSVQSSHLPGAPYLPGRSFDYTPVDLLAGLSPSAPAGSPSLERARLQLEEVERRATEMVRFIGGAAANSELNAGFAEQLEAAAGWAHVEGEIQ